MCNNDYKSNRESFFRMFEFDTCNHDYMDGGIVYDFVKITKNIKFNSGEIHEGDDFEQVVYMFETGSLHFENHHAPNDKEIVLKLTDDSFIATKEEILPYLNWK